MSHMLRALAWALLVSLLLHWVVLDLWRAKDFTNGLPHQASLQLLRMTANEVSTQTAAPVDKTQAPALASPARVPTRAASSGVGARETGADMVNVATQDEASLPVRSDSREEGLVAMRIAFYDGLRSQAHVAAGDIVCDYDAAGRLSAVHAEGEVASQLQRVRKIAAGIPVPPALRGRDFALDLHIEP